MEKLKRQWGNPMIDLQQFAPQEYVALCYRFCCDCESYVDGSTLGDAFYNYVAGSSTGTQTGGTFQEKISGKLHYGDMSGDRPAGVPYCHTSNTGIGPGEIVNHPENWNLVKHDRVIYTNYGAYAPTTIDFTNVFIPAQTFPGQGWDPNYQQILVTFYDSSGRKHYGRAEGYDGYGTSWNIT